MSKEKRIYLLGPTATGKTDLVKYLNDFFPIDIISVDSAQVYKKLDVGTAKPNPKELIKAPHHLLNIRSPIESYSVGDFKQDIDFLVKKSLKTEKIPFLYGGTMMYFNSLEKPLDNLPIIRSLTSFREHFSITCSTADCVFFKGTLRSLAAKDR